MISYTLFTILNIIGKIDVQFKTEKDVFEVEAFVIQNLACKY